MALIEFLHALSNNKEHKPETCMCDNENKRFKVSLSFSGEHRDYMEKLAKCLHDRLNSKDVDEKDGAVFYDFWFEGEINGPSADEYLQAIYHKDSQMIVVGVAQQYDEKPWCQAEWDAIQALLFRIRPSKDPRDRLRVFFLRFDDAEVGGIWPNYGYTDASERKPHEVADLIIDRLKRLGEAVEDRTPSWLKLLRKVGNGGSIAVDCLVPALLRKHPFLSVTVPLVAVALNMLWNWYVFQPAEVAIDYLNAIGQKEYERAWGHASTEFRTGKLRNFEWFKTAYSTTQMPGSLQIETENDSMLNLFALVNSKTRKVILKYEMTEPFTKEQLEQQVQKENRLWVQIAHPDSFNRLMEGTLQGGDGPNATLKIRRYFEDVFELKFENGGWKIKDSQRRLRGLKRLTE
jgi:hypothetical protein